MVVNSIVNNSTAEEGRNSEEIYAALAKQSRIKNLPYGTNETNQQQWF